MTAPRLRAEGLAWEVVEDEVVVLDLTSSEYFGLNATGTVLWQALAANATVDDLVQELMTTFDVDAPTASADVANFLETLQSHGLLESPA